MRSDSDQQCLLPAICAAANHNALLMRLSPLSVRPAQLYRLQRACSRILATTASPASAQGDRGSRAQHSDDSVPAPAAGATAVPTTGKRQGARTTFPMPSIRDTIELTDEEQELFTALLDATKQAGLGTTLRCAGGWVRDKLMGRQSLDIDIALDNLLGREFAEKINEYLKAHGQEAQHIAVIMSNPDQSKHLETARMKLRGHWIDLVNLRSEEYAQHSRIPTMTFGTPEQDALRRDFTINSLFYNLNTGAVEDWSNKGLDDLRGGIIRTPLPAKETFLDDPLRVMRAVRFASRFGFDLDPELMEAASDDEVREHLKLKVSRERIGTEFQGMIHGPDPVLAVQLIHRLRLYASVFVLPPEIESQVNLEELSAASTALASGAYDELVALDPQPPFTNDETRQLFTAALLLPLRALNVKLAKGRPVSVPAHIVRDALKWKVKDVEAVDALHTAAPKLLDIYHRLQGLGSSSNVNGDHGSSGNGASGSSTAAAAAAAKDAPDELKVELGRVIRQLKGLWRAGCVLAPLLSTAEAAAVGVEPAAPGTNTQPQAAPRGAKGEREEHAVTPDGKPEAVSERLAVSRTLEAAAQAFQLADCWQWKPVLDGKTVMAAMGMEKGGPQLGKLMDRVTDWQLAHPDGTADECRAWLQQMHGSDVMAS